MVEYSEDKAHYIVATCIIVRYENSANSQSLDLGGKSSRDSKYLIAKRSEKEKNWPGRWTVPGGKLEKKDYAAREFDTGKGEQWYNVIESLIKREVKEEVGLEIEDVGYVTSLVFIRPDGIPTLVISLYSEDCCGEVRLSDELSEFAWVSLEEAKNYDLIDGIYEEIEMLDRHLKGEKLGTWEKK